MATQAPAQDTSPAAAAPPDKHSEARAWAHLLTDFHRSTTPGDPYEQLNRQFYASGMEADRKYFQPLSRIYQALTPGLIGVAIHNFLTNLSEPVVIGNDILQLRLKRGADDLARLVTNTTAGIGGIIDFAKHQGLPHRDNDFGVTLGRLGVKPGAYLFLPFLGPTDVRDAIGMGVDGVMDPFGYLAGAYHAGTSSTFARMGGAGVDLRSRNIETLDNLEKNAIDFYAEMRSLYRQHRADELRHGRPAPPPILEEGGDSAK